jgi:hypothetical protein
MDYTVRAVGLAMINHRSGTGIEKPFMTRNTTRWIDHGVSFVALRGGYALTTRAAVEASLHSPPVLVFLGKKEGLGVASFLVSRRDRT